MKTLIIIPAHNEESCILDCLHSLKAQTYTDFLCVIVNDGSTDATADIAQEFCKSNPHFTLINLPKSEHQPGAKIVNTFNKGLESQNITGYEIICKFDADLIFPSNYLEEIIKVYKNQPNAGMVSGLVYIFKNNHWEFENLSSKNHVRGPIKSYRRACFEQMNGLRSVLGWDNIDVMLAKMHHFEVITIKELWVKHLRPTAYKYKNQKAEKLGEYFYNIGLDFPLAVISSAKSSWKNKSILEFFTTISTFVKQKNERTLTPQEIQFIRKLRWNEILNKIK